MKKYETLIIKIIDMQCADVICTSGDLKVGEFDNDDCWGE